MVIAALLVIPLLVIEESDLGQPWDFIGVLLNWGTWLAFVIEAVVMIRVTPRPMEWIKRHPIDVAVIFLSPPFIPSTFAAARLFRLLRVLRLVRIFSIRRILSLEGIRYAAFTVAFMVLLSGAAYSAIEKSSPSGDLELMFIRIGEDVESKEDLILAQLQEISARLDRIEQANSA